MRSRNLVKRAVRRARTTVEIYRMMRQVTKLMNANRKMSPYSYAGHTAKLVQKKLRDAKRPSTQD